MRLGIGMNLLSFYFPTQVRSEIKNFGVLTTLLRPRGDRLWMTLCNRLIV
jgi:hypothetical protein